MMHFQIIIIIINDFKMVQKGRPGRRGLVVLRPEKTGRPTQFKIFQI